MDRDDPCAPAVRGTGCQPPEMKITGSNPAKRTIKNNCLFKKRGREMPKNHLSMKVIFFLSATLLLISSGAMAGGGINWKLVVKNDTKYKCKVIIHLEQVYRAKAMDWRTLAPGGRTTYETGALCPCAIRGKVYDPDSKTWKKTRMVNVGLGNEVTDFNWTTAACWNGSWQLCRKAGTEDDTMRDMDFSWCKY